MPSRSTLAEYKRKRDFRASPEPSGGARRGGTELTYVVQRHDARRLHYDFRLELDGVLKSWAVPKGPSLTVGEKRLAVEVEDHPLEYGHFEGAIPQGQYGAGHVLVWDEGTWTPNGDPHDGLRQGKLSFTLTGKRLNGGFALVRLRKSEKQPQWLLLKERDSFASNEKPAQVTRPTPPRPLARFKPQLATLDDSVPSGNDWIIEPKLDGYRALCRLDGGHVELVSRNGKDWSDRFPTIVSALEKVPVTSAVLDGELCALDDNGLPRFQLLQNSQRRGARRKAGGSDSIDDRRLMYFVFDLLFLDGEDLEERPLIARKAMLESVIGKAKQAGVLVYVPHAPGADGSALLKAACTKGAEGVVAKRGSAPHRPRRTPEWIKVKCGQRQEAVVVGFTAPGGSRQGLGALLLGVNDESGQLRYAGKVGTGFDDRTLQQLARLLKPLAAKEPTVTGAPNSRATTWVKPVLVAEVAFTEWTEDGSMRHPSFIGLREDKPAGEVRMETAAHVKRETDPSGRSATAHPSGYSAGAPGTKPKATVKAKPHPVDSLKDTLVEGVRISHPDRVVDAASGVTKLDIARYYAAVAPLMLPYIANRPLALVRCPEGDGADCFFQKQRTPGMPSSIHQGRIGRNAVLHVEDANGLVSLAQFGAIEIHVWGSRLSDARHPDWIVMDLDPAPHLEFERSVNAALATRELLRSLKLESFVRTTGGKGLHVVAPILPLFDFEAIKDLTHALAARIEHDEPKLYTSVMSKKTRAGKVFVDYLRNGEGATAIAPYSARARPGSSVALPISWPELHQVTPADFTVRSVPALLERRQQDPWDDFFSLEQAVPAALTEHKPRKAG